MLKGKRGEFIALENVEPWRRPYITPFVDLSPAPRKGRFAGDLPGHIRDQGRQIAKSLGVDWRVMVDVVLLEEAVHAAALRVIGDDLWERSGPMIPVTGTRRSSAYQEEVRRIAERTGMGVCVRLQGPDFGRPELAGELDVLAAALGVTPKDMDLILDFGAILPGTDQLTYLSAVAALTMLPVPAAWRTVTLAASVFPIDLSLIATVPGDALIPRTEWIVWQRVVAAGASLPRTPSFGDYAISHPELRELTTENPTIPVSVRYTTSDAFLVRKEGTMRKLKGAGFLRLARWLVAHPQFYGASFSAGDGAVDDIANDRTRGQYGNAETWRRNGTSHHLAVVADEMRAMDPNATPVSP
ncbi:MAG TPA: beta family protein [Longimicrobium sp.]